MYETFDHTADVGLRVRAPTLDQLFAEAGRGFFSLIVANLESVRPVQEVTLEIEGNRHDDLFFDWLAELLYLFDTQHLLACQFEVRTNQSGLKATVRGESVDLERHELDMEIKAVTYHGLKVEREGDEWLAEVILDL
jgi:SHS2 domain-containing protein